MRTTRLVEFRPATKLLERPRCMHRTYRRLFHVDESAMKKSVVIVGAGPSGLVAAKTFINGGKFSVTVIEKSNKVGGLWAVEPGQQNAPLDPQMPANGSRFIIAFSDLSWQSVPLALDGQDDTFVPMFPRAWQVSRYLDTYAERFIPKDSILTGCKVTETRRVKNQHDDEVWKVTWLEQESGIYQDGLFDYMIIASGFFAEPRDLRDNLSDFEIQNGPKAPRILHSSRFRDANELLPDESTSEGTTLIIGGHISGAEAAAELAYQISSSKHSPNQQRALNTKIIHVMEDPGYTFPSIVPSEPSDAPPKAFRPLDLTFYDLSRRPPGPIVPKTGMMGPEVSRKMHEYLQLILGGDQGDLGKAFVSDSHDFPIGVNTGEMYPGFARSGDITPIIGRVTGLKHEEEHGATSQSRKSIKPLKALIQTPDGTVKAIDDIVAVIHATGYRPSSALEILPEHVKSDLECDSTSKRMPLIIGNLSTYNSRVPSLGFVGFYEAPYWGVMEMQARLIAQIWQNSEARDKYSNLVDMNEQEDLEDLRKLRRAMLEKRRDVPRMWMGDYVGISEGLAHALNITRNDVGFPNRTGPVVPARYVSNETSNADSSRTVSDLHENLTASDKQGRFAAWATFRAMQGNWNFNRTLESLRLESPSGTVTGKASYNPRRPSDSHYDAEYLYVENGIFNTTKGLSMNATRRYVYRYSEKLDEITVWFVKDDAKTVDYLFHKLKPQYHQNTFRGPTWQAAADHLCVADMYKTNYTLDFKGARLETFTVQHSVNGPKKDYTSTTRYLRPDQDTQIA